MTGALSPSHWLIILLVVLLLFGAKRLPDLARGVGASLRIVKAETAALSSEHEDGTPGTADAKPATDTVDAPTPAPSAAPEPVRASTRSRDAAA